MSEGVALLAAFGVLVLTVLAWRKIHEVPVADTSPVIFDIRTIPPLPELVLDTPDEIA